MVIIKEIFRAFAELLRMYQPMRYPGLAENYKYSSTLFIAFPSVFLWPVLVTLMRVWRDFCLATVIGLLLSLVHLALSPLILTISLVLPLLGCRIRMHHPAEQAFQELKAQMKANDEAKSG